MKKALISIIVVTAAIALAIFIYRYQILQYSAESFIRKTLPKYAIFDKINIDARGSRVILKGFKILNPADFTNSYLLEMDEFSCNYKLKGKNITEGLEIFNPIFNRCTMNIERLSDGRLNLIQVGKVLANGSPAAGETAEKSGGEARQPKIIDNSRLSSLIKLPETFLLKSSKVIFIDRFVGRTPNTISFENVEAKIIVRLDENYSRVLGVASAGGGNVNGRSDEVIKWNMSLDPTMPGLTMSNRLDLYDVKIKTFEPYYDRYSPLVFESGRCSGTVILDFYNGNIGSTNELHLSGFRFYVKQGYENQAFWDTTVPDLVKYFTSPSGEIVFDFKIKGDMNSPKFYLGPISKQALTAMAIDKISQAISEASNKGTGSSGAPKSDIEKAKEYIDLFKGLMKK
ncbi:MAG: hypothetical protein WC738_03680 [Candidatus Omnitrophota bacterium]|jgi:hypothetical protein